MLLSSEKNMILYGLTPYDRSGKVRWLLKELGLSHTDHWLKREEKEYESAEFLKINPRGRVPAMEIKGQTIFESGAICAAIADLHLEKALAPGLSSPERLSYQQWMYFAASTLDPFVTRIMIIEDILPGEVFTKKSEELLDDLRNAVKVLDLTLSQQDYLLKTGFCAADICVSYHLFLCTLWPEFKEIIDTSAHLSKYFERMLKRPAAISTRVFSFPT
jgi:glutathione S-transferase